MPKNVWTIKRGNHSNLIDRFLDGKMPKAVKQKTCVKCKAGFIPRTCEDLCHECVGELRKCFSCGIVISAKYGYYETSSMVVGNRILCSGCISSLKKRGYARICDDTIMLPDGSMKSCRFDGVKPLDKLQGVC